MSTYIFNLGKDRELSLVELLSIFPKSEIDELGDDYVVLNMEYEIDQSVFDRLNNSIKVGKVVDRTKRPDLLNKLFVQVSSHYKDKKLNFGISLFN